MSREEICDRLLDIFLSRYLSESPGSVVSETFLKRLRSIILAILTGEGEEKAFDYVERARIR